MTPELTSLHALEISLWRTATRFDWTFMNATFAPDMFEFGRSGRRYTREELLPTKDDQQDIDARLHNLNTRPLSTDLAQVTYHSEVRRSGAIEWANRSSIWDRSSGRWQLRFHQGTPCEAPT